MSAAPTNRRANRRFALSPSLPARESKSGFLRLGHMALLVGLVLSGCAAEIGDECTNSTDCSPTGDRICDFAQVGGYCTIRNCSPDACPDDALCVQYGSEPRFERSYCMAACSSGSDCRDAYSCTSAEDASAVLLDEDRSGRFCAPSE